MAIEHLSNDELLALKQARDSGNLSRVPTELLQKYKSPSMSNMVNPEGPGTENGIQSLPLGFTTPEINQGFRSSAVPTKLQGVAKLFAGLPETTNEMYVQAGLMGAGEVLPPAVGAFTKANPDVLPGIGHMLTGMPTQTLKNIQANPAILFKDLEGYGQAFKNYLGKYGLIGGKDAIEQKAAEFGAHTAQSAQEPLNKFTNDTVGKVKNFAAPGHVADKIKDVQDEAMSLKNQMDYQKAVAKMHEDNAGLLLDLHRSANDNLPYNAPADTSKIDAITTHMQAAGDAKQEARKIYDKLGKLSQEVPNTQDVLTARHWLSQQAKLPPLPEHGVARIKTPIDYEGLKAMDNYLHHALPELPEGMGVSTPEGEIRNYSQAKQHYSEGSTNNAMGALLPKTASGQASVTRGMFTALAGGAGGPAGGALAGMAQSPVVIKQLIKAGMLAPDALKLGALELPNIVNSQNQSGQ